VLVSADTDAMAAAAGTLDGIIDTVSAKHDLNALLDLLDVDGKLIMVGASPEPLEPMAHFKLLFKRLTFAGSLIGGIAETQEMLDFCGKHGITADVEVIDAAQVNEAWDRVMAADVRYRFVINVQKSLVA